MKPQLLWRVRQTCNFFGIGEGPSKGETTAANNISNLAGVETSSGLSDLASGTNFWNAILSGNQDLINKALGPEFATVAGQANQQKATTAEFGNRSGGNNAAIQSLTNQTRATDTGLTEGLMSHAADTLTATGLNLTGQAMQGDVAAFGAQKTMQDQRSAFWNDIFNSIGQLIGGFTGGGGGGGSQKSSNTDASASGGYTPGNVAISDAGGGAGSVITTGEGVFY